ncbi:hypothetical protein R1flu_016514 [Riccia fluitans]|uniref:Uncharacterized protein n=1 Tax=Riccia fluitans TaxID=41844 RepID=A0ABD1YM93_9MARC
MYFCLRILSSSFTSLSGPGDVVEDNQRTFADLRPDVESPEYPLPEQSFPPFYDIPMDFQADMRFDRDINPADILRDIPDFEETPARPTVTGGGASPRGGDRTSASPAKSNPRSTGTPTGSPKEGGQDSQGASGGSRDQQGSRQGKLVSAGKRGGSPSGSRGSPSPRGTPTSGRGGSQHGGSGDGGQGGSRGGGRGSEGPRQKGEDRDDEEEVNEPETYHNAESRQQEKPNFELGPYLAQESSGMEVDALRDHYLRVIIPNAEGSKILSRTQTQLIGQRLGRLQRPVLDPNHQLVNYGHRRWPVDEDTPKFTDDLMEHIWPKQAVGLKQWNNDHGFMARLRQLIHEFNVE